MALIYCEGEMTAKEFLLKYEIADRRANALREEYEIENELIDAIKTTANIDGLPRGNGISKVTEDKAIRLADKAARLHIAELDALRERQEVAEIIFQIRDRDEKTAADQTDVLTERYIHYNQTWEEICVKLHMSWGTVHARHKEGLATVTEILQTQNLV